MRTTSRRAGAILFSFVAACAVSPQDEAAQGGGAALSLGGIGGGPTLADHTYFIEGLGSRCFDFGVQASWAVGSPVSLTTCNGSVAQQVRVLELDGSHDVQLRVPQTSYCLGVRGGAVAAGQPLELQTCSAKGTPPAQRFALDGDAIMIGTQPSGHVTRELVIEPANDASPNKTPLVVGTRETSDAEYFRLQSVDRTNPAPTGGFVRVHTDAELRVALAIGWGAVIEVDDAQPLTLAATVTLPAGVTLRGYRKHRYEGAIVTYDGPTGDTQQAIVANGDATRITGLRLQGPPTSVSGILAMTDAGQRILIDHNELTGWVNDAIGGGSNDFSYDCVVAYTGVFSYPRPTNIHVLHNSVHDNPGYGIVTGGGALIFVQGNVEYLNRHSLTSDPTRLSGYVAYDNLLLSPAIDSVHGSHQDFDAHGSLHPGSWYDGTSGDYFDMGWNTFLQVKHFDFNDRGTPCRFASFHDNVTVQSSGEALTTQSKSTVPILLTANTFGAPNPTIDLAVGDFDGDHVDDVFFGSGVTWWFSSGGQAEWRLLNRMPEHASQLRFGDFDGDGRTDVLGLHGTSIDVSWAGSSPWETINGNPGWAITDMAVGDFDGDHASDLFLANGAAWLYAPGGRTWAYLMASPVRTKDVRFGDFTGDGKTDIFGVVGGSWQIVPGGGASWQTLRPALTTSIAGLVVADFDGDGVADVARSGVDGSIFANPQWQVAARGRDTFRALRGDAHDIALLPIGRFDVDATSDVLEWLDGRFALSASARGPLSVLSRQAMQ